MHAVMLLHGGKLSCAIGHAVRLQWVAYDRLPAMAQLQGGAVGGGDMCRYSHSGGRGAEHNGNRDDPHVCGRADGSHPAGDDAGVQLSDIDACVYVAGRDWSLDNFV